MNLLSEHNRILRVGEGGKYEGILPIVVNNEEMKISAKSASLGVQQPLYFVEDSETATVIGIDSGAFPTFEGTTDGKISAINGSAINAAATVDYSAGDNIDISNHVISVTGLDSLSSDIVNQTKTEITAVDYAVTANIANSANSATYDSLGRKIVDTYLTAHQDWTNTIQNASGNAYNSAVNWVVNQNYLTAVTGDNTPYSASANIDITDHVVSGKDWTSEIQAASSYAYNQSTGTVPDVTNLPYVQNTALQVDGGNNLTAISSYSVGHPQVPVSGESGVYLTKRDGTVYIGYSGTGGQGVDFPESADQACRVVTANSANWGDIPTKVVANSGLATGSNILYIVTGA